MVHVISVISLWWWLPGNGTHSSISCPKNPMDGGVRAGLDEVGLESDTTEQLIFTFQFHGGPLQCFCLVRMEGYIYSISSQPHTTAISQAAVHTEDKRHTELPDGERLTAGKLSFVHGTSKFNGFSADAWCQPPLLFDWDWPRCSYENASLPSADTSASLAAGHVHAHRTASDICKSQFFRVPAE